MDNLKKINIFVPHAPSAKHYLQFATIVLCPAHYQVSSTITQIP